jgi:hypothetical protein
LLGRSSNGVLAEELAKGNGGTLIEQDEHQRLAADGYRLRTAKSITAFTC